jgi:hypothetical protein
MAVSFTRERERPSASSRQGRAHRVVERRFQPLGHAPLIREDALGRVLGRTISRRTRDAREELVGGDLQMLVRVRVRGELPGRVGL